ncbi:transport protein particle component [Bisporella sp. PMI_857]|nr:transport protein particle component [Bisporella sp. PMI_857]
MSFDSPLPPYNASDPSATFLASSCLDLLMIELVPMSFRVADEVDGPERDKDDKEGKLAGGLDEDELRDAAFYRLENLGYRVGQGLVERFSRDRPRFTDTLDVIKFLCKDLWMLVFRKQIDNLKTNHRGVYVLTDNSFRPFSRMSTEVGGNAVARAQPFLWFPCGIIRGALASMGINATVEADTNELPGATFQIRSIVAKP